MIDNCQCLLLYENVMGFTR